MRVDIHSLTQIKTTLSNAGWYFKLGAPFTNMSEWVIKFDGLSRRADSEVHVVHWSSANFNDEAAEIWEWIRFGVKYFGEYLSQVQVFLIFASTSTSWSMQSTWKTSSNSSTFWIKCKQVPSTLVTNMNPKAEGSSQPQVETLSVSESFTRTSVRGSKMNAIACTVNISNVNFSTRISIPPEPVFNSRILSPYGITRPQSAWPYVHTLMKGENPVLRVPLTTYPWCRQWLDTHLVTNHYPNQWFGDD